MMLLRSAAFSLAMLAALGAEGRAGQGNDTLTAAFQAQLPSLDRYYAPGREGFLLGLLAYDALIYRDPNSFEIKPLLATSWKQVDDKVWEFELRPGVKFHNGDALTAEDVAFSLRFASNAENRVFNRMTGGWVDRVEVVEPLKLRVFAREPTPLALEYLAQLPILPAKYREQVGKDGFNDRPVGTGPYKIEKRSGSTITFVRNEEYFSGGAKNKPYIKTMIYRTIPDVNTQVAELISGGIDWAYYIPDDQAERLKRDPKLSVTNAETFRIGFLTMDAAGLTDVATPLKDRRVREAIARSIDRGTIAQKLVGGSSHVIDAACTPSQFGCTKDVAAYGYDPEKARALMAEAGYAQGFDIDIYGYRSRPVAEAIIGYLRKINIRANLRWLQYSAVIQARRDHKTPIVIDDFGSAGVNDVGGILPFFFAKSPDDQSQDPILTADIQKGGSVMDPALRREAYANALRRIAEQVYWEPLFTMPVNYISSSALDIPIPGDENVEFWRAKWK